MKKFDWLDREEPHLLLFLRKLPDLFYKGRISCIMSLVFALRRRGRVVEGGRLESV